MKSLDHLRDACVRVSFGSNWHTGFLVAPDIVVTAANSIEATAATEVQAHHKNSFVGASVETVSRDLNLGILRLIRPADDIQPLSFAFDVRPGDDALIYGFPRSLQGTGLPIDAKVLDSTAVLRGFERPLVLLSLGGGFGADALTGMIGSPVLVSHSVVAVVVRTFTELSGVVGAVRIQDALELLSPADYARAKRAASHTHPASQIATAPEVGVVAALDEELDYLLELPFQWTTPKPYMDGASCRFGTVDGKLNIVAATANSMGSVPMAVLTTKLLSSFNLRLISLVGVCGGRKEKGIMIGDIVMPNQVFHYQFGAYKHGAIQRELRVENIDPQLLDVASHLARRTDLLVRIRQALPRGFTRPNSELRLHVGPVGSADLVVKDPSKLSEAVEADRKTIAIEMESYAFMKAATLAKVRWAFVAKSVSDFADAEKDDEYREYAKYTSAMFSVEMIRHLMLDSVATPCQ